MSDPKGYDDWDNDPKGVFATYEEHVDHALEQVFGTEREDGDDDSE